MLSVSAYPLLALQFDAPLVRLVVWAGLVGLTISLLVLMRTRWGQSHPLRKCIVLSLLAHLLLGVYTTTVNIVNEAVGPGDGGPLRVALVNSGPDDGQSAAETELRPWQQLPISSPENLANQLPSDLSSLPAEAPQLDVAPTRRQAPPAGALPAAVADVSLAVHSAVAVVGKKPAAAIEAPQANRSQGSEPATPEPARASDPTPDNADGPPARASLEPAAGALDPLSARPPEAEPTTASAKGRTAPAAIAADSADSSAGAATTAGRSDPPGRLTPATIPLGTEPALSAGVGVPVGPTIASIGAAPPSRAAATADQIPSIYQLRVASDHTSEAVAHGGTRETEAAVVAALRWLVMHQSGDGRWDGQRLEAGREAAIDGHERRGAGTRADTGITGLALLALLASGHTHLEGEHRESVRRGLEYLLSVQAADGNLGGNATLYEKMYCHAMASFAMSEAYAMTHDDRLQKPVRRAIGYTLSAQHGTTGGWRYQPGEAGDTSQLGWQFMALKSAELAGIAIPPETRSGMIRYLGSVASGKQGGLSSYRPGHKPSRTMTAEALVCRQFLGMARSNPAGGEAGTFLLEELPGEREPNFYYWYYATLGMYQLQDEHWQKWNKALQTTLIGSQRTEGDKAGSWDPDPIWGAYGGRAYSTALGTLCLEVYYRFLPFYVEAAGRSRQQK